MNLASKLWSGYLGGAIGTFAFMLIIDGVGKATRQPEMNDVTWANILRRASWTAAIWPLWLLADLGRFLDGWVQRYYDRRRRSGMHA